MGYEISENIPLWQHSFSHYLKNKTTKSIFLDPVTPGDEIDVASKIKSKRSLDHNNISSNLKKASIQNTAVPLTHTINLPLVTGVVSQKN
jgi:3-hydroxymyristoyl/3-hydroxydecanoyl-(acyl carrier protein) dehydratase